MTPDYDTWFPMFNLDPPPSAEAIAAFERKAGFALPADYARFLAVSNGGYGEIGEYYVDLWTLEKLLPANAGYRVAECAPGLFLFGSDGGGEAFAFDLTRPGLPVVMVPFIPLRRVEAIDMAPSFNEFLERLYSDPEIFGPESPESDAEIDAAWRDGIAQVTEPFVPGQPGPWNLAQIGAYSEQCEAALEAAQRRLEHAHGLGGYDSYSYDLVKGRIDFLRQDQVEVSFGILPIGSWSETDRTWRWAWGDPSLPETMAAKLAPLESLAENEGWIFYDDPAYKARLEDAWFMAALAYDVLGGLGVYLCPEEPRLFLLLTSG